jgi:hypothetical protein
VFELELTLGSELLLLLVLAQELLAGILAGLSRWSCWRWN